MAGVTRFHRAVLVISTLLPAASFFTAGGALGFTMYARTVVVRMEITARDANGRARAIAPTSLAARVGPSAVPFFAGADHDRRTYGDPPLASHLGEIARLACAVDGHARAVDVTLFERRRGGARETHGRAECAD
jgi:hypothetical protein